MASDLDKLEALFQEALALSENDRRAFIDALEDPAMAEDLRRLLAADAASDDRLELPVVEAVEILSGSLLEQWVGRRIGPYRISEPIAAGGMGAVFKAEREDEQFQLQVAIKVMGSQLLSVEATERFRSERQILASLNHPNIARLLDGGTLDNGLPYLVMEYIDGQPIDAYCDAHRLDTRSRLRLFQQVCAAVEHAHRNLVVHRDLKPSNILIDEAGVPKLLDFGIAKLLDGEAVGEGLTQPDMRVMTPEYASPEQIQQGAITTATDVYALGVLLYRLLTGQGPYAASSDDPRAFEEAVVSVDPPRPSTVLDPTHTADPDELSRVADLRDASPVRLRRHLSGDLDNIILMALRKEPERRYASVRSLSEDISRFLENRPVEARASGWVYRTRKFVTRHSLGVSMSSAAILFLVLFSITTYRQNQLISAERDVADQVSSFLIETFEEADPELRPGETLSARDILDAGRERIDNALGGNAALRARLLLVMGDAYAALSYSGDAVELLEEAAQLGEAGELDAMMLADAYSSLSRAHTGAAKFEEAAAAIERSIVLYEPMLPESIEALLRARVQRAHNLNVWGQHQAALDEYLIAQASAEQLAEDPDGLLPDILHNIGVLYFQRDEIENAGRYLRAALATGHPDWINATRSRAFTIGILAAVLRNSQQPEEALEMIQEALKILLRIYDDDHASIGVTYNNMAAIYMDLERFDDAAEALQKSVDLSIAIHGPDHYSVANGLHNLGAVRLFQGQAEETVSLLERSIEIKTAQLPEVHAMMGSALLAYGRALRIAGRVEEAESVLLDAVDVYGQVYSAEHMRVGDSQSELGYVYFTQERLAEAEYTLRQALVIRELEGSGSEIAYTRSLLGRTLATRGNCAGALEFLTGLNPPEGPGPFYRADAEAARAARRSCLDR